MVSKKSSGTRSTLNTRTSTIRSGSRSGDVWLGSTTGLEFEGVCADILEGCGFRVRRMGGTADGGRDIIMWNNRGKVVVECKHQAKPVGRPVVQKLHSAVVTEKAAGGIVIATGGFSSDAKGHTQAYMCSGEALATISRIRQDTILLVDNDGLSALARVAGMNLHAEEDPSTRDTDISSVTGMFAGLRSYPAEATSLMNAKVMGHDVDTCWVAEARVEQGFHNSAGMLVHKMKKKKTYACGPDGNILDGKLAKKVKKGGDGLPVKTKVEPSRNDVIKATKTECVKSVKYKGGNGATYVKRCEPTEGHIHVKFHPVGILRTAVELKFLRTKYRLNMPWDKEIACKACGKPKGMFKPLLICNECGRVVHVKKCGGECGRCKKTLCDSCAVKQKGIIKTTRFCSDCLSSG